MALSQLQGLSPLGGSPGTGAQATGTGTDPNAQDDTQPKKRAVPMSRPPTTNGQPAASPTFAQMSQQGQARPAPVPAPAPQAAPLAAPLAAPQAASQAAPVAPTQPPATTTVPNTRLSLAAPVSTPPATPSFSPTNLTPSDTNPGGQLPPSGGAQIAAPTGSPISQPPTSPPPTTPTNNPTLPVPSATTGTVPTAPTGLTDAITQSVMGSLANPSAYGAPQVQQSMDALNQQLALDQTAGRRSIDETMAARGLYDSTATGDQYGQLEKTQDAQRAALAAQLATQAATTYGADRTAAQGAATNLQGQVANQGISQQAQNLNTALGYGNLTGQVNGDPTLAAQSLAAQTALGQGQIAASEQNAQTQQIGGIVQAGLLGQSPTAPDPSYINYLSGGMIGSPAPTSGSSSAMLAPNTGAQLSSALGYGNPAPTSPTAPSTAAQPGQTFIGSSGVTLSPPGATNGNTATITVNGQQTKVVGTTAQGRNPIPGQDYYIVQGPNGQPIKGPAIGSEFQQYLTSTQAAA